MQIRSAKKTDIELVVRVHCDAFSGFFLTSLGSWFLRELYSGFESHPNGIFLVAVDKEKIIGFVVGTSSPKTFFSDIRKCRGVYFFIKAMPAVIRNPVTVLRKLLGALFYRGDAPVEIEGGALISSIGVLPESSGKGCGAKLMYAFEQLATSQGAKFIYLTTDKHGNEKVNAFYKVCGYQVESCFIQSRGREMYRYMKKLN